ncbi:hypothetical protein A2480_01770 [Candidatus Uhrbacteria bacterium RIFOXYC2_FULL_47_19]|uniref:SbsA Ig-like domain-containing protein n=1 Tax=Candidatus Uhrbacteria bacterium RIFOXYC2_FULL_47_19 TaxID=1802424 RepID=A0A1F7WEM6_9BACT|nr:MAG: hypothetical protein A2480_01770 [Candidatus Uhrbacteria bacterium RIFOXYC2_FULL_47_19]
MLGRYGSRNQLKIGSWLHIRNASRTSVLVAFILLILFLPEVVSAQMTTSDVGLDFATATGLATTDIRVFVGRVINAFFALLGFIVVLLYIYAGYLWMTARGDAAKVDQAKKVITNTTIGLIIMIMAYSITAFIIQALTGHSIVPGAGGGDRGREWGEMPHGGPTGELGNGIIEYHYPEVGQIDVPRNTNISITFKRPLVLSTVFRNYDDAETYDIADDTVDGGAVPEVLQLNTDNFKIIAVTELGGMDGSSPDERFDTRYPDEGALVDPPPTVRITAVAAAFDPLEGQTITISPALPIGSPTTDVVYRVALRGGDNGIKVWSPSDTESADPDQQNAFTSMNADGGYFWPFTTGTMLDLTPPHITSVVPIPVIDPSRPADVVPRNQLLQIYFNEAVDPTTVSGIIGEGGGFTNIEVKARCLPDTDCDFSDGESFISISGKIYIGNRYRTAEFVPSEPCEGITENSCGNQVFCLPRNVEIRVRALAATLSSEPPKASRPDGVLDMVGNSFDGNGNETAEGPESAERRIDFNRNNPPAALAGINDTARWIYHVGEEIDLRPPTVMDIDPKSAPPVDPLHPNHPEGPSRVPTDLPITVLWDKIMSVRSMRTGAYDEVRNAFSDGRTTIALRAKELAKKSLDQDCSDPAEDCPYIQLDPPYFFMDLGEGPVEIGDEMVTRMMITHRGFFTANDMGYTMEEMVSWPGRLPVYQPVIGAQIQDTLQNCFFPSVGWNCAMGDNNSCCNRNGQEDYLCSI